MFGVGHGFNVLAVGEGGPVFMGGGKYWPVASAQFIRVSPPRMLE
ncbi:MULTISPECIES: hypothetical protein [unclassified Sulfitobacter]|nr:MULTISPECIES: hypothetical protein [unclassified Sulfitobacter]